MRPIEVATMNQARNWKVCTMNEFRAFMGLKRMWFSRFLRVDGDRRRVWHLGFATFEEWNPDLEIAQAARMLYGHIDNLELYVRRFIILSSFPSLTNLEQSLVFKPRRRCPLALAVDSALVTRS
jgi:hypothetical protein